MYKLFLIHISYIGGKSSAAWPNSLLYSIFTFGASPWPETQYASYRHQWYSTCFPIRATLVKLGLQCESGSVIDTVAEDIVYRPRTIEKLSSTIGYLVIMAMMYKLVAAPRRSLFAYTYNTLSTGWFIPWWRHTRLKNTLHFRPSFSRRQSALTNSTRSSSARRLCPPTLS